MGVLWGMADLQAGLGAGTAGPEAGDDPDSGIGALFRARYPELVRLADLLGADDPEDIAQEAFARLIRTYGSLRDPGAALAYVRASVCNLTRNRHRHLRLWYVAAPADAYADTRLDTATAYNAAGQVIAVVHL